MSLFISSLQNPRVKHVVKLRERRHRKREHLMLIEGYEELQLALESGVRLRELFYCPDLMHVDDVTAMLDRARVAGADLIEVSPPVFEKMAYREGPDGWLALAPAMERRLDDLATGESPLLIVAEAVEKPGNIGAILRSADAAGVTGVIVCDPLTDLSNPNVVRASKGTVFSVPVAEATGADALDWLRERGIAIAAATPQATTLYTDADLRGPLAIAVGTEKHGLSQDWLDQADLAVRIPMSGRVNSLNVATATALLIFEAIRQRSIR